MVGKFLFASFVSWMASTSASAYSSHSSTRGSRAFNEFTFQVAIRTTLLRASGQVTGVGHVELGAHGLAHRRDKVGPGGIERSLANAERERVGELADSAVSTEERNEAIMLGGVLRVAQLELALDHAEDVHRDARV